MKIDLLLFDGSRLIREAMQYAGEGGQALHVWNHDGEWAGLAKVAIFRTSKPWAHLFDQDEDRLKQTARFLGVNVLKVERRGEPGQHIDLCAGPLRKAMTHARKG